MKWYYIVIVVVIFLAGVSLSVSKDDGGVKIAGISLQNQTFSNLNTSSTVTSTVRLVLAEKSSVQVRCFGAPGAFDVYLGFGTSTGLAVGTGYYLKASTTVTFTDTDLWPGNVYAVAAGTTTLSICNL